MTNLERLIGGQVAQSTVTTVRIATEQIAESLAQEILKDPTWRAEMRRLVQRAFDRTLRDLTEKHRPRGKKARRR